MVEPPPASGPRAGVDRRASANRLLEVAAFLGPLVDRFTAAGREIALVGGSVRDTMLGRLTDEADLDLTTNARPEEVTALVEGWADAVWETGIRFGTVGLRRHRPPVANLVAEYT